MYTETDCLSLIVLPGSVDATELKKAFEKMNVHVTDKEVGLLLKR